MPLVFGFGTVEMGQEAMAARDCFLFAAAFSISAADLALSR